MLKVRTCIIAAAVCTLLVSCGTFRYNPAQLPDANLAKVTLTDTTQLDKIDDSEENFFVLFGSFSILISEGEHTLWLRYYSSDGTGTWKSGSVPYTFIFEAGKEYDIIPGIRNNRVIYHLREAGKIKEENLFGRIKIKALPEDRDIDLYVERFPTDRKYEVIQTVQTIIYKTAFSGDITEEEADYLLKKMAIELGADAIVDLFYEEITNTLSYGGLKANGIAVRYIY